MSEERREVRRKRGEEKGNAKREREIVTWERDEEKVET